ncbi:hypothetical protein [Rhodococcus tukisamuensis]|uniref:HEAT repeat-containing protein n=1 Tax=Rhodococcus tukisamuensis TaxID=168276 RepID=A0A1G6UGG6_9NOCA|nr:hypothetical protein [Rhodococcus tukisamuensis]SDD40361.1 hypothetical protein SAMN05444580_104182 [Rhodococcus tukisamuensis]
MNSVSWRTHLADVDWPMLEHAYGDASDVPGWIEGLAGAETVEESLHELWAAVLHQGTLYDSTAPAMASIASLLGARQTADAESTAWLLLMFADAVRACEHVEVDDAETAALVRSGRDSLIGIAALVRPLIADDGPEAAAAALLQAAARTADSAALDALAARASARPTGQVEQACVAALTTLGVDVSAALADGDPGLVMAATLARIAAGSTETTDLDALVAGWELAVEVAPRIAFGVGNLPEWLSTVNPEASADVLAALPTPDEATIAGLVDVVIGSRSNAPAAVRRLLALAALPEARPEAMMTALRQCPPTPEVCDLLVALAERVTTGGTSAIGSSTFDVDARADSAFALLRAGDGRWARPMAQALLTNPAARGLMVATSASGRSALGHALVREHAPSATMLIAGIRQALRQEPPVDPSRDGAGHLIELLASWPAEATAGALPEVRELLTVAPKQAADALATWGDTTSIDRVREATVTGDATVLLALARLTKDPDDFRRVLDADLEHKESAVLAHWADRADPRFLDWCRSLVGTNAATSDYQRDDQLTSLRILAAFDSGEAATGWPVLRSIIDAGRGPIEEAIGLALDWRAQQWLPPEAHTDFEALLADLVVTDRKNYNGPLVKTSTAAAIALLDLGLTLPGTPARIVKVVACAVTDRWARELGLRLTERLAGAPETVRRAVAKKLRSLVDRDERFDSSGDIAVEDERTLARLRPLLQDLEAE